MVQADHRTHYRAARDKLGHRAGSKGWVVEGYRALASRSWRRDMSIAEIKDAFNEVAAPAVATVCLMDMVQGNGIEWQVLTFRGIAADGADFEIKSDRVRPGGSLIEMARETAKRLIATKGPQL